jgi:cellobiose phosphorylase
MKFGYFDDLAREYVITDPHTPVKWINYIGTLDFGGFIDHTGGALLCRQDPALNRITKYSTQTPSSEMKGETLYLRLHTGEGVKVFSPFFVPTLDAYDLFETHVGLGYSRYVSEYFGLHIEVLVFVPQGAHVEVRQVRITNKQAQAVELDAVPLVEYTHVEALKQLTNGDWVPQTMVSRAAMFEQQRVLVQYAFMNRDRQINFFSATCPASSFETDRKEFLGANEYGTWQHPLSLDKPELTDHEANRGDNIAALMLHLGRLAAGETRSFITVLGQAANLDEAKSILQNWQTDAQVDAAFTAMQAEWQQRLSALQVHTPDADLDRMVNVFNIRQCWTTYYWSRYLSYYQLGFGSRGIGFRDSSQDVLAIMASGAKVGQTLVNKLLSVQKRNGSAYHQFNPLNMVAGEGESVEREDRPHYYSDDALWAVLAVTEYLKETGDFAYLKEEIPFYDKDKQEKTIETASVEEHLRRALYFTKTNVGQHGLPLLGFADWNDCVNLAAGAESLFTAHLYGRALLAVISLYRTLGKPEEARAFQADYDAMKKAVEDSAWDGEWYKRYFDYDGSPLGSHVNEKGRIYLNGQSWAVLSGFAAPERAQQAMESVTKYLNTPYGIKLSAPGFDGFDPRVGGITTYPPGAKENGGIFLHPNPWAMIAETMLGHGDRAKQYYDQINPAKRNETIEVYECEPYVYAQNILGDEHPQFGLARNSWLSGTSSWTYQAATQYILGVRADYSGLIIDPCIPAAWEGFTLDRRCRGAVYHIRVHNPNHVCKGVVRMEINGNKVFGNCAAYQAAGSENMIEVWLG